jgi:NADP-dependent alcohol dehydrogenase
MRNFEYYNPTRIIFGKGTISKLSELVAADAKVLLVYGGGSIKRNGVYDQVKTALEGIQVEEFGGVEPNPQYETCMKAVDKVKETGDDFLLAVGGGSVLDACKFIAAAAEFKGDDAWDILKKWAPVEAAIPLGAVLTLPATGSEMNAGSVISRESTSEKLFFGSDLVRPRFSILDPEATFSLPPVQTANGIVDAFIHVTEQYLTYRTPNPLQDRLAEAILKTLIEEGPKALEDPNDYEARANIMWCATNALNGWLSLGVPTDWAAHVIGHELTALYGVDHGTSLAIVAPGVWAHESERKKDKLLQYGARVWGISEGSESERIAKAIAQTDLFFRSLGIGTTLADHNIPEEACELVAKRLANRDMKIGEHGDLGEREVAEILRLRV